MYYSSEETVIIPTILCGGAGARLWPLSRSEHPKQFLTVDGSLSFLQKAFLRGAKLDGVKEILTVTSKGFFHKVQLDFTQINKENTKASYLLEPCSRNTAAAVAAASYLVKNCYSEDAIMLVLPSDQLIQDQEAFSGAVKVAVDLATSGRIVTFGIQPSFPATGYGYIEAKGSEVVRFIEKPPLENAINYLDSGNFLWNSGMFCFRVGTMLDQMRQLCPKILEGAIQSLNTNPRSEEPGEEFVWDLDSPNYSKIESESIDYAVMEKTKVASVVPCNIGWSDIGCWKSYGELLSKDSKGNNVSGNVIMQDSKNCVVNAGDRLVAVVGLDEVIIADTPDALLVTSKNSAQDVKSLYKQLKDSERKESKECSTVTRPWGTYTVLEENTFHKVKRIEVVPGAKLSLQSHEHRSEHWVVVQGRAKVVNGSQELILSPEEHTFIPAKCKHRLENIGDEVLIVLEVQTGKYLGEDDIIRFEDQYGRAKAA